MRSSIQKEDTNKLDFAGHLEELRRRIIFCVIVIVFAAICFFFFGEPLMSFAKIPIRGLVNDLIFISPSEAFISYVKITLLAAFIVCFPVMLYQAWSFLSPAFSAGTKRRVVFWFLFALLLFASGISFSYFIAIPAALKFLINFGEGIAVPSITLGKYVSFFTALIFTGGVVFEMPVILVFLGDTGILESDTLKKKRHIAVIAIMVLAAVITPTQDIINLIIFAIPMIALYEIGILITSFLEKRKK